jgi:hypothetical protein
MDWSNCLYRQYAASRDFHTSQIAVGDLGRAFLPGLTFPFDGPGTASHQLDYQSWVAWRLNQGTAWGNIQSYGVNDWGGTPDCRIPPTGFRASGLAVGHAGFHEFNLSFNSSLLPTDFFTRTRMHGKFRFASIKAHVRPRGLARTMAVEGRTWNDVGYPRFPGLTWRIAAPGAVEAQGALPYSELFSPSFRTWHCYPSIKPGVSQFDSFSSLHYLSGEQGLQRMPLFEVLSSRAGRVGSSCVFRNVPKVYSVCEAVVDPSAGSSQVEVTLDPVPEGWIEIPEGGFYNALYNYDHNTGFCEAPEGWRNALACPPFYTPLGFYCVDTSSWPNSRLPANGKGDASPNSTTLQGVCSLKPFTDISAYPSLFPTAPAPTELPPQAWPTYAWQAFVNNDGFTPNRPNNAFGYSHSQACLNPPLLFDVVYEVEVEFSGVNPDVVPIRDTTLLPA